MAGRNTPAAIEPEDPVLKARSLRYCGAWLLWTLLIVLGVGGINALVDPYLVFGSPRIAGFNAAKPVTISHTQLAKDHLVLRVPAHGVMLGSSKVEVGLDPGSARWPADARPAFNYGIPGSGIDDAIANLKRTIAHDHVKRAIVLIELEEYMRAAEPDGPALAPSLLPPVVGDMALATFSTDALIASAQTVLAQRDPDVIDLSAAGTMSEGGFRKVAKSDGMDALFLQKDRMLVGNFATMAGKLTPRPDGPLARLDRLAALIALAREHGIALDIAIAPFHADYLVALDRAGLWPRYERAKREVSALVAREGRGQVPLWDFLGFDRFSTEAIPGSDDRTGATRWFWEPSHFKQPLGEIILATIYHGGTDYGVRLTLADVDARLAAERVAKRAYMTGDKAGLDRLARASK